MRKDQAYRVLALEPGASGAAVNVAARAQLERFEAALAAADNEESRARVERALALTRAARDLLLLEAVEPRTAQAPSSAAEDEETAAGASRASRRGASLALPWAAFLGGLALLAVGFWPRDAGESAPTIVLPIEESVPAPARGPVQPAPVEVDLTLDVPELASERASETAPAPVPELEAAAPEPDTEARAEGPSRSSDAITGAPAANPVFDRRWLDAWRLAAARQWRSNAPFAIPRISSAELVVETPLPEGMQVIRQRDGVLALQRSDGAWVMAVPILDGRELRWVCLSSTTIPDCARVPDGGALTDAVREQLISLFGIVNALEAQAEHEALALDLLSQAERNGDSRAAVRLADLALADGASGLERGIAHLHRALEIQAPLGMHSESLRLRRRVLDLTLAHPQLPRARRVDALLACRAAREAAATREGCPEPGEVGLSMEATGSGSALAEARWWYEQGLAEGDVVSIRSLARVHALGMGGEVDRRRALGILEDAAERFDGFSLGNAAHAAWVFSEAWSRGWNVAARHDEASWWASQAARIGHLPAALKLTTAFTLGIGTTRNSQRARSVLDLYQDVAPVFEVGFYRSVGRTLDDGIGVEADAEAAEAWFRRAFEVASDLADAGDADASLELASMHFAGEGTARDLSRAAEMYAAMLDHDSVLAANMLAWIEATAPDGAVRDGASAVRRARSLVTRAPSTDHYDTLAAAHAETGDFEAAIRAQRHALELLEQVAEAGMRGTDIEERRAEQRERLVSYEAGRPWRDVQD